MNLKMKMVLLFIIFGAIPSLTTYSVSYYINSKNIEEQAFKQLTSIRDLNSSSLTQMFSTIHKQAMTMSSNILVVEAMKNFKKAFHELSDEYVSSISDADLNKSLNDFYINQFKKKYNETNDNLSDEDVLKRLNLIKLKKSKVLQYHYITNNKEELGAKDNLFKASDGSEWSENHEKYHATFKSFTNEFGYYDFFLIDNKTGHIVYSVFKELDFATSLIDGPYKDSNFAKAFKVASENLNKNEIYFEDMATYFPSYDYPAAFVSIPIYEGENKIGVLIFQLPIEKLDAITTNNGMWEKEGFGKTGQYYVVGQDGFYRSIDRRFVEHKDSFVEKIKELNLETNFFNYILRKETTALGLKVDNPIVNKAIEGESAQGLYTSFDGKDKLVSYKKLDLYGLNWAVISEVNVDEIKESLTESTKLFIYLLMVMICIISFLAYLFSLRIVNPINKFSDSLSNVSSKILEISKEIVSRGKKVDDVSTKTGRFITSTSANMDEMNSMLKQTFNNTESGAELVNVCLKDSKLGIESVDKLNVGINEISHSAEGLEEINGLINSIAEKTSIINDIVFQTRLLSFNASIEAARAGQHGKGFAVVASEVANLAKMSGDASSEIDSLLSDSKVKVEESIGNTTKKVSDSILLMEECKNSINNVSEDVSKFSMIIESIKTAAKEQTIAVSEIQKTLYDVEESNKFNIDAARELLDISGDLGNNSNDLNEKMLDLQKIVNK